MSLVDNKSEIALDEVSTSTNGNGSSGSNGNGTHGNPVVTIADGILTINHLSVDDRQSAEFIGDQENQESALISTIQIGVRAIQMADGVLDARTVEERFAGLTSDLSKQVGDLSREITEKAGEASKQFQTVAEGLLDEEDGAFVATLASVKEDFLKSIDGMFDEDSKQSAVGKLEKVLQKAQEDHQSQLADSQAKQQKLLSDLIDPNAEDGPIGRLNRQVSDLVKEQTATLDGKLVEVLKQLTAETRAAEQVKDLKDKGTQKGTEFEQLLFHAIEPLVLPRGDTLEDTSKTRGADGNEKGDLTLTLNPEGCLGETVRIMFEAKDSALALPESKREMRAGISNREATVGVIVFASADQSPIKTELFHSQGNLAWCVYDKETENDSALKLALMWSKWMALREVRDASGDVDLIHVGELIRKAQDALKGASVIRRSHTSARKTLEKHLGEADQHLTSLESSVTEALNEIETELSRAEDGED